MVRQAERVRRFDVQKKKVIRVETEETQDYVRESLNLSPDEAEDISFVSSAISIPQKTCFGVTIVAVRKKALRY